MFTERVAALKRSKFSLLLPKPPCDPPALQMILVLQTFPPVSPVQEHQGPMEDALPDGSKDALLDGSGRSREFSQQVWDYLLNPRKEQGGNIVCDLQERQQLERRISKQPAMPFASDPTHYNALIKFQVTKKYCSDQLC